MKKVADIATEIFAVQGETGGNFYNEALKSAAPFAACINTIGNGSLFLAMVCVRLLQ